jgi:hypothetical protein
MRAVGSWKLGEHRSVGRAGTRRSPGGTQSTAPLAEECSANEVHHRVTHPKPLHFGAGTKMTSKTHATGPLHSERPTQEALKSVIEARAKNTSIVELLAVRTRPCERDQI